MVPRIAISKGHHLYRVSEFSINGRQTAGMKFRVVRMGAKDEEAK